jgi:autotransporter-associated beta strand protein
VGVTKTTEGSVLLTVASTYGGDTRIERGALVVATDGALDRTETAVDSSE